MINDMRTNGLQFVQSSASAIDDIVAQPFLSSSSTGGNFISNYAINLLGDSISSNDYCYAHALKCVFIKYFKSDNYGLALPYVGFFNNSGVVSNINGSATNAITGRFYVLNVSGSLSFENDNATGMKLDNTSGVLFYDNTTPIGSTMNILFYNIANNLLQTTPIATSNSGKSGSFSIPTNTTKIVVQNTSSVAIRLENIQIVKDSNNYCFNILASGGKKLTDCSYEVIDKWFDNAEYAILALSTNDNDMVEFQNRLNYISTKYNSTNNKFTKLIILNNDAGDSITGTKRTILESFYKSCKKSVYISLNEAFDTYDSQKMIALGLMESDGVHPTQKGHRVYLNKILRKLGVSGSYDSSNSINGKSKADIYFDSGINQYQIGNLKIGNGRSNDSSNFKIGSNSLANNLSGQSNIAIGNDACANRNSNNNIAIGANSLQNGSGTTGGNNVAMGVYALINANGAENTALGYYCGVNLNTGNGNVFLGTGAGNSKTDGSQLTTSYGAVCLGSGSKVSGDYQVQLGDSNTTTYAYGAVQNRSDERDKAEIQDTELGLDFIMKIRPVQYKWDYRDSYFEKVKKKIIQKSIDDAGNEIDIEVEVEELTPIPKDGSKRGKRFHQGVIAQEIEEIMKETGIDFGGYQDHSINGGVDVKSIGYQEFIAPIIKAIQEQQNIINGLKLKIEELTK